MTTTINVKTPAELKAAYKRIAKGIASPFKSTRRMFMGLGAMIDRDTMLTFKKKGAYLDREKWMGYNWGQGVAYKGTRNFPSSTRNRSGLYKKRPGTDGAKSRRFSSNSKLLQASGSFKNSFRIVKIGADRMKYGTQHKLGEYIMSDPSRPTVQYTRKDQGRYSNLIYNWWFKNTKI